MAGFYGAPSGSDRPWLVTGGAGFIGSHLTEVLVSRGERVVVLDDLSTGRLQNLCGVLDSDRLQFVLGSVLDEELVSDLVGRCDVVVHLAAVVGVQLVMDDPERALVANVRGAHNVLRAAAAHGRRTMVVSSSEVYGKNPEVPVAETAERVIGSVSVGRWAYSTSKAVGEVLARAYGGCDVPVVVVRLFNTTGPRQSPDQGMVIPRLARQALGGSPLTVFGDGRQTRSFCHVTDVVDALLRLMANPGAAGHTFNVGSSHEVSMLELAHRICEVAGRPPEVSLVPYADAFPPGYEDVNRRVPDTSRLRRLTGWVPRHTLADILRDVLGEAAAEARVPAAGAPRSAAG